MLEQSPIPDRPDPAPRTSSSPPALDPQNPKTWTQTPQPSPVPQVDTPSPPLATSPVGGPDTPAQPPSEADRRAEALRLVLHDGVALSEAARRQDLNYRTLIPGLMRERQRLGIAPPRSAGKVAAQLVPPAPATVDHLAAAVQHLSRLEVASYLRLPAATQEAVKHLVAAGPEVCHG